MDRDLTAGLDAAHARAADRLRAFVAAHPEVTVFAAHDPGGFPAGTAHIADPGIARISG